MGLASVHTATAAVWQCGNVSSKRGFPPLAQGWRMLLESLIDHEYPLTMKMEVEAPTVRARLARLSSELPVLPGQHWCDVHLAPQFPC